MAGRLARHAATDAAPGLEIVRLAADGFWLATLQQMEGETRSAPAELQARLIALTRPVG